MSQLTKDRADPDFDGEPELTTEEEIDAAGEPSASSAAKSSPTTYKTLQQSQRTAGEGGGSYNVTPLSADDDNTFHLYKKLSFNSQS